MVDINYRFQTDKRKRVLVLWKQWVNEYNNGKTVEMISNEYINPKTGKNYSRSAIYYAFEIMKDVQL